MAVILVSNQENDFGEISEIDKHCVKLSHSKGSWVHHQRGGQDQNHTEHLQQVVKDQHPENNKPHHIPHVA